MLRIKGYVEESIIRIMARNGNPMTYKQVANKRGALRNTQAKMKGMIERGLLTIHKEAVSGRHGSQRSVIISDEFRRQHGQG